MSEIYEITAIQKKQTNHKVYVRAADAERAERFGRDLHRLFGVRGKFQTRVSIWNPSNDLSMHRYISKIGGNV